MATSTKHFDGVPECLIETLLIVHGGADRSHAQFTQVCERWTCILAPWIRDERHVVDNGEYGVGIHNRWSGRCIARRVHGRWNGRCRWFAIYKSRSYGDTQVLSQVLSSTGTYKNGQRHGEWIYYACRNTYYPAINRYVIYSGTLRNGVPEGRWRMYTHKGIVAKDGMYTNGRPYGTWRMYDCWDQRLVQKTVFDNSGQIMVVVSYTYRKTATQAALSPLWIVTSGRYNTQ